MQQALRDEFFNTKTLETTAGGLYDASFWTTEELEGHSDAIQAIEKGKHLVFFESEEVFAKFGCKKAYRPSLCTQMLKDGVLSLFNICALKVLEQLFNSLEMGDFEVEVYDRPSRIQLLSRVDALQDLGIPECVIDRLLSIYAHPRYGWWPATPPPHTDIRRLEKLEECPFLDHTDQCNYHHVLENKAGKTDWGNPSDVWNSFRLKVEFEDEEESQGYELWKQRDEGQCAYCYAGGYSPNNKWISMEIILNPIYYLFETSDFYPDVIDYFANLGLDFPICRDTCYLFCFCSMECYLKAWKAWDKRGKPPSSFVSYVYRYSGSAVGLPECAQQYLKGGTRVSLSKIKGGSLYYVNL